MGKLARNKSTECSNKYIINNIHRYRCWLATCFTNSLRFLQEYTQEYVFDRHYVTILHDITLLDLGNINYCVYFNLTDKRFLQIKLSTTLSKRAIVFLHEYILIRIRFNEL